VVVFLSKLKSERSINAMQKTRLEKITKIKNLQKMERQKHNNEERAARTKRLCLWHKSLNW